MSQLNFELRAPHFHDFQANSNCLDWQIRPLHLLQIAGYPPLAGDRSSFTLLHAFATSQNHKRHLG